jgi:hypothetical protein
MIVSPQREGRKLQAVNVNACENDGGCFYFAANDNGF